MSATQFPGLDTLRTLAGRMTEALRTGRLDEFMACAEQRIQTLKELFSHPEYGHPPDSVIRESIQDNQNWIGLLTQLMEAKKTEIEGLHHRKKAQSRLAGAYRNAPPAKLHYFRHM